MYNIGTVTTTANSTKLIGVGTRWKENISLVSPQQVIQIMVGTTVYNNSIHSIQSNTELTLNFPIPVAAKDTTYVILTTMVDSITDAGNKIVTMNIANVQYADIQNRIMTETGVIDVKLPDGTVRKTRTEAERDKLLDGKFDKAGGVIICRGDPVKFKRESAQYGAFIRFLDSDDSNLGYVGYGSGQNTLSISNQKVGTTLTLGEDKSLKFNGIEVMKVGDYGVGAPMILTASDNLGKTTRVGTYVQPYTGQATTANEYPTGRAGTLIVTRTAGDNVLQEYRVHNSPAFIYYRSIGVAGTSVNTPWILQYNTGNTTKDSNGNLKAASPIIKVFADSIELNEESEGVEMEHLGIGHYLIKGVLGFNADGAWGINNGFVIPQDHNGKNMVLIDYDVKPDGNIELFVFHQQNVDMPERFQNKRIKHVDEEGEPVYFENYEPCDVPESRWIDMRVEMPPNSIYNLKQAEAERLAKEAAEKQAEEDAKKEEDETLANE